jgi:hypothetical protein
VQEVELLFAKALVNPMAARRARRAAKKDKDKRGENSGEPEVPLPYAAGPGPPHTATSQIGNGDAGESLLHNAPAAAEQALLSVLDGNALPPRPSPQRGTKRKARAPRPRRPPASSGPQAPSATVSLGEAERVQPQVTGSAPGRIKVRKRRVSKMVSGMTRKRGCRCFFVAKQVYVDASLCEL